jgi:hypothetical protein
MRYSDGDPDYDSDLDAAPCDRHYGPDDFWLRCTKPVDDAAPGEAFGDYGFKTCYRTKDGDDTTCGGGGTSGTMTILNNRYFYCQ